MPQRADGVFSPRLGDVARSAWPAIVISAILLLPFLGKAYTSDDVTFLLQAKHVLTDPLHPTAFEMVVAGVRMRLSRALVTGPIMAYLLVPCVLLAGAEWVPHVEQLICLIGALIFTAALALRLGLTRAQARIACVAIAISPAVLAMATTAMPDVTAMMLGAAGMERLACAAQTRRRTPAVASALLLALAAAARPHAILLLPCAAGLGMVLTRRLDGLSRKAAALRSLFVPILALTITAVILYATRDPVSGDTTAAAAVRRIEWGTVAFNLGSFALHWVVGFPMALGWIVLRGRRFWASYWTVAAIAFGIVLGAGYLIGHNVSVVAPALPLVGLGVAVLVDAARDAWLRRDWAQAVLIVWLLIPAVAATYVQLPPKLLLVSAPAMAMLIGSHATTESASRGRTAALASLATAGALLAVMIIRADEAWANVGREGGRVAGMLATAGNRVWLDGASGFQWYAMSAGAEPVASTPPLPSPGDVVVASLYAKASNPAYPNRRLVSRRVFDTPGGRVQGDGAGFYTNTFGPWPWVWGRHELGRVEVWRVEAGSVAAK
jgi:hypothetical protein